MSLARAAARTLAAPVALSIALALVPAHAAHAQKRAAVVDTLMKATQKKPLTPAEKSALGHAAKIQVRKDVAGMKGFAKTNVDCDEVLESANDSDQLDALPPTQAVSWLRCAAARSGATMVLGGAATVGTGDHDIKTFSMDLPAGDYMFTIVGDKSATQTGFVITGPGLGDDEQYGTDGHILIKKMTLSGGQYVGGVVFNGSDPTVVAAIMVFRMGGDE